MVVFRERLFGVVYLCTRRLFPFRGRTSQPFTVTTKCTCNRQPYVNHLSTASFMQLRFILLFLSIPGLEDLMAVWRFRLDTMDCPLVLRTSQKQP